MANRPLTELQAELAELKPDAQLQRLVEAEVSLDDLFAMDEVAAADLRPGSGHEEDPASGDSLCEICGNVDDFDFERPDLYFHPLAASDVASPSSVM